MTKKLLSALAMLALPVSTLHAQQPAPTSNAPAEAALAAKPWEFGPFFQGGFGVGNRSSYTFTNAGARLGKVMTNSSLPGILRGQFELAGEILPYWQSFTPPKGTYTTGVILPGGGYTFLPEPFTGGTFSGISITPIILRWDLTPTRRFAPFLQGAGGLIWTNHKYPTDVIVPHGTPGGTSVWNFTPQFGIGMHYFLKDRRAIDLSANAIHISSASLGDHNPGVNASVQFQIGYSWWK
jgi:hypothetical protein